MLGWGGCMSNVGLVEDTGPTLWLEDVMTCGLGLAL